MTNNTAKWAHLPNAKYIDRVVASIKTHPKIWEAVWDATRNAAWEAVWDATRNAASNAAWDAILALVAYDDCAYLLDCEPDELRILGKLGDHRAILLLPACIAFKDINALQSTTLAV